MLTQVARSRVHYLVTARDESVSRISFSLSLSPYSCFCTHVCFFLFVSFFHKAANQYLLLLEKCIWWIWLGSPTQVCKRTWIGNPRPVICWRFMGLWGNPASSTLPSVMVVVSGHVVLGFHAKFWQVILYYVARTRSQGSNNDLLQFASLPSIYVSLHWSEVQNWKPCCSCCLWNTETSTSSLSWENISISPLSAFKCTDSHPFSPLHQEYSLSWV